MVHTLGRTAIIESVPIDGNANLRGGIERALRACGLVEGTEKLLEYREERDFVRMGGESYGAVFMVRVCDDYVGVLERKVYAKAIIGGFGEVGTALTVRNHVERLRLLASWGIRTPRVYGHGKGTIYEEFIEGGTADPRRHTDDLARIAAILDHRGASPLNYLADVMDGRGEAVYVDAGFDLGNIVDGMPPNPARPAERTLLDAFPKEVRGAVEKRYSEARRRLTSTAKR